MAPVRCQTCRRGIDDPGDSDALAGWLIEVRATIGGGAVTVMLCLACRRLVDCGCAGDSTDPAAFRAACPACRAEWSCVNPACVDAWVADGHDDCCDGPARVLEWWESTR